MEYIPQSAAQRFENGTITSWEYDMQNVSLNVAPISIRGRYPKEGFTRNLQSDSVVHVINGTGILGINDGTLVKLAMNDQIHLTTEDAYYFEGNLEIIYAASPPWTPAQAEHIPN